MSLQKELMTSDIKNIINDNDVIVTQFDRLSSQPMAELRTNLRSVDSGYFVVKNTLFKHAIKEVGFDIPDPWTGHTGIAYSNDIVKMSKCLAGFIKENEDFSFRFGFLGEKLILAKEIDALAKMPPREVLIGKLLGTMNAPISNFAGVLRAQLSKIVYVLNAIADSKQK